MKKFTCVCLLFTLYCICILPYYAAADEVFSDPDTEITICTIPTIEIETVECTAGESFRAAIILENNPGIAGMTLKISYDTEVLSLTAIESGNAFSRLSLCGSNLKKNPVSISWLNMSDNLNDTANGTILYLHFDVSANASVGFYDISIIDSVISDALLNDVEAAFIDGKTFVSETKRCVGDVNADGRVDAEDVDTLVRYFAGWPGYAEKIIDPAAADIDVNGILTRKDAMLLNRDVNNWIIE